MTTEVVADATLTEIADRFSVSEDTVLLAWESVVELMPRVLWPRAEMEPIVPHTPPSFSIIWIVA